MYIESETLLERWLQEHPDEQLHWMTHFKLRHDPRELVSWTVRLWIGEEKYEARAVDASIHGICMAGIPMALLEVGKSYRAEIWIPGGPEVACLVEVRNFTDRRIGMRTGESLPLN